VLARLVASLVFSFSASAQTQNAPSAAAFVRDANGEITEIMVLIGGNREIRGKRVN
jgi:hypothetical protein